MSNTIATFAVSIIATFSPLEEGREFAVVSLYGPYESMSDCLNVRDRFALYYSQKLSTEFFGPMGFYQTGLQADCEEVE